MQRAAEAGSADAGYALGTTYDPSFIEETGAQGIRGDFYRHGRGTSERRSSVRKPHKKGFGNWNRLGQWLPNGRMSRGRTLRWTDRRGIIDAANADGLQTSWTPYDFANHACALVGGQEPAMSETGHMQENGGKV